MMNPPHLGHIAVVDAVHRACALDRVVVVPSGDLPPHRRAPAVSARARLTMAVRAFADMEHVVVSDAEVERGEHGELGYMVDTLDEMAHLPEQLGYDDLDVLLTLVVGADQAASLPQWHDFARIASLARIAIVARPDQLAGDALAAAIVTLRDEWGVDPKLIDMSPVAISSTQVREVAAAGDRESLRALVPGAIVDDVLQLYGPHKRVGS